MGKTPQLPISPQETQIQPPSLLEKISAQKKKILIGVGVFFGILIFAGIIFGAYKFGQRQVYPEPVEGLTPTPPLVATPTPDPTADWETYTNTKYGYSIKYPPTFELKEIAGVGAEADEYKGQEICIKLMWENTSGSLSLSISIASPEIKGKSIMCFRSGVGVAEDYKEQININNVSYLAEGVRDYRLDGGVKNYTGETLHLIFENGFEIEYGGTIFQNEPFEKYLEKKETLLQILSTFKFLEEESCGAMTLSEAKEIALASECIEEGSLKDTSFCNENTGTWWIDLDVEKPGCAPACVINVSIKKAEINWRCTGLIPD